MFIAQATATTSVPSVPPAPIVREITGVSCPAVTQMIKFGGENLLVDVSNIQRILRDGEGMTQVFITGDYDETTRDAVIAFQKKYASEILGPWGPKAQPTGIVSLTTMKKFNQIACGGELTLDENEMQFISVEGAWVAQIAAEANAPATEVAQVYTRSTSAGEGMSGAGTTTGDDQANSYYPYNNDAMTAGVAGGSTARRFGNYFRNLFR